METAQWDRTEAGMRRVAPDGNVWDIVERERGGAWLMFNGQAVDSLADNGNHYRDVSAAVRAAANHDESRV